MATGRQIEAGGAFVRLFADDSALKSALSRARSMLTGFGSALKSTGAVAAGVGGAILTPFVGALTGMTDAISDTARVGDAANAFGLTVERFSAIAGAAKTTGEPLREFIESMVTLGKVANEGATGKGEVAAGFFEALNLNAQEFVKLAPDEQFYKFFDAVNTIPDPLQRVRNLMVAFGEDGGKFLLPLLGKSSDELRKLGSAFEITNGDYREAKEAQLAMSMATAQMQRAYTQLVLAFTSGINWEEFTQKVTSTVTAVRKWIGENQSVIRTVVAIGAGLVAGGAAISAFGFVITGIVSTAGALGSILGFLLSIKGVVLALAGVGLWAFFTQTDTGRAAIDSMREGFMSFVADAKDAWGGVVAAIQAGDIEAAFKIIGATLKYEWQRLVFFMTEKWNEFKDKLNPESESFVLPGRETFSQIGGTVVGGLADLVGGDDLKKAVMDDFKRDFEAIKNPRRARTSAEMEHDPGLMAAWMEMEQARARMTELIQSAKARAEEVTKQQATPTRMPVTQQIQRAVAALPDTVKGTFSSWAITQSLNKSEKIMDRVAKNTQATADGVKSAVGLLEKIKDNVGEKYT